MTNEKAKERLSKKLENEKVLRMLAHIDKIIDENILDNIAIETLLQHIGQLEQENNKLNKTIDEMENYLAGIAIWNNEKEEPLILKDKEEVKKYFEKEVVKNK